MRKKELEMAREIFIRAAATKIAVHGDGSVPDGFFKGAAKRACVAAVAMGDKVREVIRDSSQ